MQSRTYRCGFAAPAAGARDGCARGRDGGTRRPCALARLAGGAGGRGRDVRRGERRARGAARASACRDERCRARARRARLGGPGKRSDRSRHSTAHDLGPHARAARIRGSVRRVGARAGARPAREALAAAPAPPRRRRRASFAGGLALPRFWGLGEWVAPRREGRGATTVGVPYGRLTWKATVRRVETPPRIGSPGFDARANTARRCWCFRVLAGKPASRFSVMLTVPVAPVV